jgi:hypothetical protein
MMGPNKIRPKFEMFGRYYAQHLPEDETKVDILSRGLYVDEGQLYRELEVLTRTALCASDDIDLSYRMLRKGKSNYYFSQTTVLHYIAESTIRMGFMKRFQEAMNFSMRNICCLCLLSIGMKMGTLFFIRKMFQVNLNLKVPQSLVFYSMIWNYYRKLLQFFGKVSFHDLNTEKW